MEDHELSALDGHAGLLRVVGSGGSRAAAQVMLRLGSEAIEAGGIGVYVESSRLTHSRAEWQRMAAEQHPEDLLDAYVSVEIGSAGVTSRGMSTFGLAEMILPGSHSDDGTLEPFLLHCLTEPAPSLREGDAISWRSLLYRLEVFGRSVEGVGKGEFAWSLMRRSIGEVAGLDGVTALVADGQHNLALTDDGTVRAWGCNRDGRLGDGTTVDRAAPGRVGGLADIVQVAAGGDHSLALTADGVVMAWGENRKGQLGDGTREARHAPVRTVGLSGRALAVAAGSSHSLALLEDGTLMAWGWNCHGQLGDGCVDEGQLHPVLVRLRPGRVAAISASMHSLALLDDGTVATWGFNSPGVAPSPLPTPIPDLPRAVAVSAGPCSMALSESGAVWTWGPECPPCDGSQEPRAVPSEVVGLPGPAKAVVGGFRPLAIMVDGSVITWGSRSPTPTTLSGIADVQAAASGTSHSIALRSDGTVTAWGDNRSGELGLGRVHVAVGRRRVRPLRPARLRALGALVASAIELRPRPAIAGRLPIGATKLGGRPDLPASYEWPAAAGGCPVARRT